MQQLHWYPGHMTKARRMMVENLKTIDVVIELVDARAPFSTRNPDFDALFASKSRIIILNKADLAAKEGTELWKSYYKAKGISVCEFTSNANVKTKKIIELIEKAAREKTLAMAKKGITKITRVMIAGIPNVGKSTFINRICGENKAHASNKPGVTRGKQWVKISPYLELMDTPGLLWPKLISEKGALRLAFIGAIKDEIMDEETLSQELILVLKQLCFEKLLLRYKKIEKDMDAQQMLDSICKSRGFVLQGAKNDYLRCAQMLIDEFRSGIISKLTLETPEMIINELENEKQKNHERIAREKKRRSQHSSAEN